MSKIVVVGSANTDMIIQVPHLPGAGETILGNDFATVQGGKGANQAVGAARLGADVTFVARLGKDSFGKASVDAYRADGILTDYITWDDETPSGVALITVGQTGENMIAVASGANWKLSAQDVRNAENVIASADYVLLQLEIPLEAVLTAAQLAKAHDIPIVLNPAPASNLPKELTSLIDILTPNETELSTLAGKPLTESIEDMAKQYAEETGIKTIVVTLGSKGSFVLHESESWYQPTYPVQAIDTTAAGDAFNAGLVVSLANGSSLRDAVRYASAVGALSVTKRGAQTSLPSHAEVNTFLQQHEES